MNNLHERRMGAILACLLLILLMALTGCGGGDASADEAEQHDRQTTQPVACAASGCTQ
ncbi:MAG: hypothetical protein KA185_17800 [Vitreoscilla sp.]|nr:hypothetical protein [Vitreoscilla sp.]